MVLSSLLLQSRAVDTFFAVVAEALNKLAADIAAALPRILAGLIFLIIAAAVVKIIKYGLTFSLERTFADEPRVYRQFIIAVVMLFLWFGVGLSFLSVVGLEQIAASLGSAAGFLALGVSYALSSVIADVVAGVYLLRDEDFMPGDEVDIGGTVGTVQSIELRKTRLTVNEGEDTMVRNNAEIEKKWTKLDDEVQRERAAEGEFSTLTHRTPGRASQSSASVHTSCSSPVRVSRSATPANTSSANAAASSRSLGREASSRPRASSAPVPSASGGSVSTLPSA